MRPNPPWYLRTKKVYIRVTKEKGCLGASLDRPFLRDMELCFAVGPFFRDILQGDRLPDAAGLDVLYVLIPEGQLFFYVLLSHGDRRDKTKLPVVFEECFGRFFEEQHTGDLFIRILLLLLLGRDICWFDFKQSPSTKMDLHATGVPGLGIPVDDLQEGPWFDLFVFNRVDIPVPEDQLAGSRLICYLDIDDSPRGTVFPGECL